MWFPVCFGRHNRSRTHWQKFVVVAASVLLEADLKPVAFRLFSLGATATNFFKHVSLSLTFLPTSLSLSFITSVSNKAAGLFIAFRPLRSWEQTGCSQVTWFTAMGNPSRHRKTSLLSAPLIFSCYPFQNCYFSLIIVSIIIIPSFICSSHHLPAHCLHHYSFPLPSSCFSPPLVRPPPWIRSLCSLFCCSSSLLGSNVETHILLHPLLWICYTLICRMDTECSSRQADRLQRLQILKDCFYSEEINDHSAGKKSGTILWPD